MQKSISVFDDMDFFCYNITYGANRKACLIQKEE